MAHHDIADENAELGNSPPRRKEDGPPRRASLDSGSITIAERAHELILRGTKKSPTRGMKPSQWQATIHHLHLANLGLLGDLDLLRWAPGLQVLYVYDNRLTSLNGLGALKVLTHIYANNNDITDVGFEAPPSLEQLHLNGNCIELLTGLQQAMSLSHLDIGGQRTGSVRVERESLWGIANSLRSLTLSHNGLEDEGLAQLVVLQNLTSLDLSANALTSTSVLSQLLFRMPHLASLKVKPNPCTAKPKWREALVIAGASLEEVDGKAVAAHERAFLMRLAAKRSGMLRPAPRQESEHMVGAGGPRAGGSVDRRPANVNAPYEMEGPGGVVVDAPPLVFGLRRPLPSSSGAGNFRNGVPQ